MMKKPLLALALAASTMTGGALVSAGQKRPKARPSRPTPQTPPTEAARHACPMHPEVVSAKPGECPKCGMALRLPKDMPISGAAPPGAPPADAAPPTMDEAGRLTALRIPDVEVYDQDGRRLKFYTDLVKGKTVAVNFIFTTCTTVCPPLTATFRRVQQQLAADGAGEVRLISISVDPTVDTPERLRDYAAKFKAAPGWTFVTGDKLDIDRLLRSLGSAVADKNQHTPSVLVGSDPAGRWTRTYGLAAPSTLVKIIKETAAANHSQH